MLNLSTQVKVTLQMHLLIKFALRSNKRTQVSFSKAVDKNRFALAVRRYKLSRGSYAPVLLAERLELLRHPFGANSRISDSSLE